MKGRGPLGRVVSRATPHEERLASDRGCRHGDLGAQLVLAPCRPHLQVLGLSELERHTPVHVSRELLHPEVLAIAFFVADSRLERVGGLVVQLEGALNSDDLAASVVVDLGNCPEVPERKHVHSRDVDRHVREDVLDSFEPDREGVELQRHVALPCLEGAFVGELEGFLAARSNILAHCRVRRLVRGAEPEEDGDARLVAKTVGPELVVHRIRICPPRLGILQPPFHRLDRAAEVHLREVELHSRE
mmetsp:Transcript_8025/g.17735  ORF Transcript_8025/g.17735 Transcript_8025/m.17735 type:complete len:246 (-) Transcript_8025:235-972(-)